jgi:hypothetical protein
MYMAQAYSPERLFEQTSSFGVLFYYIPIKFLSFYSVRLDTAECIQYDVVAK